MKVTILLPTMNEEKTVGKTLESIPKRKGLLYEKIIVDTNSTDNTIKIAMKYGCKIINESRKGYGRAYKTGLQKSTGEIIVCADADNTYPMEEIPRIITMMQNEGLDFITCSRFPDMDKGAMAKINYVGNIGLTFICNLLFNTKFKDTQGGMWFIRKKILPYMKLNEDDMEFSTEIKLEAAKMGNMKEIPITFRKREGEAKQKISNGFKILKFMLKRRFLSS